MAGGAGKQMKNCMPLCNVTVGLDRITSFDPFSKICDV